MLPTASTRHLLFVQGVTVKIPMGVVLALIPPLSITFITTLRRLQQLMSMAKPVVRPFKAQR